MSSGSRDREDAEPHPLGPWGLDDRVRALLDDLGQPDAEPARVVRSAGGGLSLVVTAAGEQLVSADSTPSRQRGLKVWPVTGDWVLLDDDSVVAVAPRLTWLARSDPSDPRREQVLVANVDLVGCVQALDRPISIARLERLAALVWDGGAQPFALLTKADRSSDPSAVAAEVEGAMMNVDVAIVSAKFGDGVPELARMLRDHTAALLGPSGSGKSTLVNVLARSTQPTTEVRAGDAKGRHTTTARELFLLEGGGVLVDTPGLRAVGLGAAANGVDATFADIAELAASCRFRDCRHTSEPGCAVRAAVKAGDIESERLDRYLQMRAEVESVELRSDRAAARARDRRLGRQYREARNRRNR